ncbi:hypothetical protein ACQHIV_04085 [Kribbella sp. GL6]|uniref:hypothetical protein n=1 Tax=Kribbella sp. GL6 TaxID=3419765 RepID=UPI003D07A64D
MEFTMTAPRVVDRREALAHVRAQAAPLLGQATAKRVRAYTDGGLYVSSTGWAAFWAWLVDSVLVNGSAVALGVAYGVRAGDPNKGFYVAVALLVVLPLLYGWFYANGRGVGAMLAGTRLVRMRDGSRIGLVKAGWAMLIRTLLWAFVIWCAFDGAMFDQVRESIDESATKQLRNAGFDRLPDTPATTA